MYGYFELILDGKLALALEFFIYPASACKKMIKFTISALDFGGLSLLLLTR